ncbi:MAG: hypothetical protein LBI19_07185 [Oscillospiraceae bacterium]|jgi:hypothetical protein|nr:hypothetical protein [Oscillospiraceae bacterium]
MKYKRIAAIAALAVAALILPALAATFTLGDFTAINNESQKGWGSNGTDDKETNLPIETLTSAKTLVLEFSKPPTGGMQIIWQGDGDDWAWNQTNGVIPDGGTEETTIRIDLAKTLINYDKFKASTHAKIFLGYYSTNVDDLGVTRATLEGATSGGGGNAQTGESPAVKTAAAVLILSVCAAAVLGRKMKAR